MARPAKRIEPDHALSLFSQANQELLLQSLPGLAAVKSAVSFEKPQQHAPAQPPAAPRAEKFILVETPNAGKLTIALTGRAPITIDKADWPIIAQSKIDWTEDAHQKKFRLVVRQHTDLRTIVYGIYEYRTTYAGDQPRSERGGEYLSNSRDVPGAIARTGHWLGEQPHSKGDYQIWQNLIYKTVSKLPATEVK
jgi:hypothetical protein